MGIADSLKIFPRGLPAGEENPPRLLLFCGDDDMIELYDFGLSPEKGEGRPMKKPVWTADRLEKVTLALTALFAAVTLLWFLLPRSDPAVPTVVDPAHSLRAAEVRPLPDAPGLLEGEILDLNTASEADLTRLPGIGEKRAEDIVAWREENGGFSDTEELMEISGIGEGTYERVAPYVTTGGGDDGTDPGG